MTQKASPAQDILTALDEAKRYTEGDESAVAAVHVVSANEVANRLATFFFYSEPLISKEAACNLVTLMCDELFSDDNSWGVKLTAQLIDFP